MLPKNYEVIMNEIKQIPKEKIEEFKLSIQTQMNDEIMKYYTKK